MTDLQPVVTDTGFEIRDPAGNVIWETSGGWSYPPGSEAMEAVFDYENVNTGMRRILRLLVGIPEIQDERQDSV